MSNSVLELKDVTFSYGGNEQPIIQSLNLNINEGEFISIIGASGSGKSTLFRLITGLEQPTNGVILLNGKQVKKRLGNVGYMPQQDLLMSWRTTLENACLPLELKGMSKVEAKKQVLPLLDEFSLSGLEDRYPHELSGGMRQRVSFLRSILSGADLLLLDEPFSALDAITKLSMQEWLLEQWKKHQKTILFITHDVDEALFLSDRIFVFPDKPDALLEEVVLPLNRPRQLSHLNEQHVLQLKNDLINKLRGITVSS